MSDSSILTLFAIAVVVVVFVQEPDARYWACVVVKYVLMTLLFVGGLASLFSMLASIIHFQILAALGLFFVTAICCAFLVLISRWNV